MLSDDELRALADALEPMARAPRFEDFDVPGFCAWVRACANAEPVARIYTDAEMVHRDERWGRVQWIEPESELAEGTLLYTHSAPAAPQAEPCIGNDSACPCQDGDACHYKDSADGTKAWPVPQSEPKRDPLHGLAPTHRCPACGAFWRQCDDASWNLRSASCCGLCDAGRVELVCWLDEPKRGDRPVRDLLAIIHCDGGHHTEAVGLDQSILDAMAAVCELKGRLAMEMREPGSEQTDAQIDYRALYHDLLFAVGNKHAGETRHETALRYIREAERSDGAALAVKETK